MKTIAILVVVSLLLVLQTSTEAATALTTCRCHPYCGVCIGSHAHCSYAAVIHCVNCRDNCLDECITCIIKTPSCAACIWEKSGCILEPYRQDCQECIHKIGCAHCRPICDGVQPVWLLQSLNTVVCMYILHTACRMNCSLCNHLRYTLNSIILIDLQCLQKLCVAYFPKIFSNPCSHQPLLIHKYTWYIS